MTHRVSFNVIYTPDEGGYNALEPITGTTSWGATLDEAREMITEALELYFAETAEDRADDDAQQRAARALTGTVQVNVA